ncbi:hypothetical protein PISMIDRAFT_679756 [Pisolithus microcarpus 441]|uniref:Uncharacterized protein n=1 Tax=Pisolithus microcarpus 441 TaxID=765257 RepID=A0A0C9YDK6_9AGAM|nr:hypothetical protein PISMIDRAFT_679756 [Pisolithus microcarpus 441]
MAVLQDVVSILVWYELLMSGLSDGATTSRNWRSLCPCLLHAQYLRQRMGQLTNIPPVF